MLDHSALLDTSVRRDISIQFVVLSFPLVPASTTAAGSSSEVPDGPSGGRDAESKALPPYFVSHYIAELGCQLDSRSFWLMRFDGNQLQPRDEAGLALDTGVCVWLRR